MNRTVISITTAIVTGFVAVYILPPIWLGPLAAAAAICTAILAIIVRLDTKTAPPANPVAEVILSVLNLPEQPQAKVNDGWALTTFLTLVAFLASLALSVMVRANA